MIALAIASYLAAWEQPLEAEAAKAERLQDALAAAGIVVAY